MTRRKSVMVTLTCPICGNDFEVIRSKRSKRKYCSYGCSNEMKRRTYVGRTYTFHKLSVEKEKEICKLYVDKLMPTTKIAPIYDISVSTVTRVLRKYHVERTQSEAAILCRKQHADIYAKADLKKVGLLVGKKSPKYINGSGKWAVNIFERDGYTCQDCGLHEPEIVEAHHIIHKRIAPELQFELSNGVTLCPNCHRRRHVQITKTGTLRIKTKYEEVA